MDTKKSHGGSRPKTGPGDKRGGARPGSGPLPKNIAIGPFSAKKSDTESKCAVVITRCNYCGAHSVAPYTEDVMGWTGDDPTVSVEHDGIAMQHKQHCVKAKGYEPPPKFGRGSDQ